jgi:Tol biopolymer transport system component
MPIAPGTRLGPYEIVAALGVGGMGEVYRARDTRLGREIALKVLPADVAADPVRRQRFEQEARAASALNHPNIMAIYDVGSEGDVSFMVSELVDGESLRNLVARGPLGLRKLLDIAVQLADGLAAAHAASIMHRDLKPENLMLTRDGRLKILDFGLAKQTARPAASASDATVTVLKTEAGIILGTVAYMSPEQALGAAVDFRSDQFSFGLIVYELLTGRQAFQRDTAVETMAAILREEPEVANTPFGAAPPPLRWTIERCLAKEPAERYSHSSDLYRELRSLRDHLTETVSQSPAQAALPIRPPRTKRWKLPAVVAAALVAGFAAALLAIPTDLGMEQYRFVPFASEGGYETGAAWSPDGNTLAYSGLVGGVPQILTRSLTAPTPVVMTKSEYAAISPFWSPDATRIYYLSGSPVNLWSIGVAGGAPELVMPGVWRAALSPDGKTLATLRYESTDSTSARLGLWLSSPPGAAPRKYDRPPISGMRYYNGAIQFSPDGKTLGFWMLMWNGEPEFWLLPLPSGNPVQPFQSWRDWVLLDQFRWLPDSRRVLFPYRRPGSAGLHLWIADTGNGRLQQVTSGSGSEAAPAVSPNGRTVAFTAYDNQGDLVQIPLDGSSMGMLKSTSRNESGVEWSPGGLEYAYVTDRTGVPEIWLTEMRTGRAWPILAQKDFGDDINLRLDSPAFSPDGQRIAFSRYGTRQGKSGAIWISPVAGGQPVRAVEGSEDNPQLYPSWSPDGNSIAFLNSQAGLFSLATAAVGGGARPTIVKEKIMAAEVKWSPKGDWILYRRPDALAIVSPDGKRDQVLSRQPWILYNWAKDGAHVYAVRSVRNHYTVASIAVLDGAEKNLSEFDLPPEARFGTGLSLAPDGKTLDTTLYTTKGDIWLLEDFRAPGGLLRRLWRW